jgi:hypothetical protein
MMNEFAAAARRKPRLQKSALRPPLSRKIGVTPSLPPICGLSATRHLYVHRSPDAVGLPFLRDTLP